MKSKLFLLIPLLSLIASSLAQAHAFLDHADPKVGSTVNGSPPVVKIWFTMEVQAALTNIQIFDSAGHEVDRKDDKIDPNNNALMIVSLPKLPMGTYKVIWHAVCPWGHHTTGNFTFDVAGS